ncbi:MAG TPA: hypothetical protein EYP39_10795, partial [Ghiorsea sp.]|nr:hypothetical protein [Ghiorsea sp.]
MPICDICEDDDLHCNYCNKETRNHESTVNVSLVHGAVYIAARIVEMFDQPTMAKSALKTANFTAEDFSQAAEL